MRLSSNCCGSRFVTSRTSGPGNEPKRSANLEGNTKPKAGSLRAPTSRAGQLPSEPSRLPSPTGSSTKSTNQTGATYTENLTGPQLLLQRREERLGHRVIETAADLTHRGPHPPVLLETGPELSRGVLRATIRVEHRPPTHTPVLAGHHARVADQIRTVMLGH